MVCLRPLISSANRAMVELLVQGSAIRRVFASGLQETERVMQGRLAMVQRMCVGAAYRYQSLERPSPCLFQTDCAFRVFSALARNSAMFLSLAAWYAHPSAVAFQR